MKIRIGPTVYRIEITPGPLFVGGEEKASVIHERTILISGATDRRDWADYLADQMHKRRCQYLKQDPSNLDCVSEFAQFFYRKLTRLGGEKRLMRLRPKSIFKPKRKPATHRNAA